MNAQNWSDDELLGYLSNQLPTSQLTTLESELRDNPELRDRLEKLNSSQEFHSVGEIWRRHRLSCPSREELQQHLNRNLNPDYAQYLDFHLNVVQCEICQANYADLQTLSVTPTDSRRRHQIFESSAGFLAQKNQDRS